MSLRSWVSKYTGILRSLRVTYIFFNIANISKLSKNKTVYKQLGIKKQVWQNLSHADIRKASNDIPWMDKPGISKEEIAKHPSFQNFSKEIQEQLLQWNEKGYMIIPNFFTKQADAINNEIEKLLEEGKINFNFTGRKIMDAWKESELLNSIFRDETVLQIMRFIFGKDVVPFQTINFKYGSEQKPHSDSIHMTTEPLGYLAAIWIALEDIQEGSGELLYYPGSQKLHYIMSEDYDTGNTALKLGENNYQHYEQKVGSLIKQHNLKEEKFLAKKGDMLVWHANLLHGGSAITKPGVTRKSMVCHYFAKDVLCYHEISQRPAVIS